MTKRQEKIVGTVEEWDEGLLGRDESYAQLSELSIQDIEKASGLKSISIRMKESLINDLKLIAEIEGIGYQPLMKQVLQRFVDCQLKDYARMVMTEKAKEPSDADDDDNHDGSPTTKKAA